MATTIFTVGVAPNRQGTVVTNGGSATNNVSSSQGVQVNPVGTASSHNGIARPAAGGPIAPVDIQTVADVRIDTSIDTNMNVAKTDNTTKLTNPGGYVETYEHLFVDAFFATATPAAISAAEGTTVTWDTQAINSYITGFNGGIPTSVAY